MESDFVDWMIMGLLGFAGGVVVNIVFPRQRGVLGFVGAAFVGLFCGLTAGMTAKAFEAHTGWQRLLSAVVGVLGYQIIGFLARLGNPGVRIEGDVTVHHGDNIGHNKVGGDMTGGDSIGHSEVGGDKVANSDKMLKLLIGGVTTILVAVVIGFIWFAYYIATTAGGNPNPTPPPANITTE